jgi:hypothetical protein
MLLWILVGPEHAVPFFCRNISQFSDGVFDSLSHRLKLSQALRAVLSPSTPQEFQSHAATSEESGKRVN